MKDINSYTRLYLANLIEVKVKDDEQLYYKFIKEGLFNKVGPNNFIDIETGGMYKSTNCFCIGEGEIRIDYNSLVKIQDVDLKDLDEYKRILK